MVSVIIVTWNSEDYIDSCLQSLYHSVCSLELEIYVVDNASQDNTIQIIKTKFPNVNLIQLDKNTGYTHGINEGLDRTTGDFILLLNPDTIVHQNAIEIMVNFLRDHDDVGLVGPQLLNPDGTIQPSCREFPSFDILWIELVALHRLFSGTRRFDRWRMGYFEHKSSREVDQPMGACVLIRQSVMRQIGKLDENFFMFYSDVDLCYQVRQLNYTNYFLIDAQVTHHKGVSVKRVKPAMIRSSHQSMYYFLKKHNRDHFFALAMSKIVLTVGCWIRIGWEFFRK